MIRAHRAAVLVLATALAGTVGIGDADAKRPPRQRQGTTFAGWAPADTAEIHPGVQVRTEAGQCTANFVFTDTSGGVYLGMAAHCASDDAATQTNGCEAETLGTGIPVRIAGEYTGTLVYSSWDAMQAGAGETDENACEANDFALIRIADDDRSVVNPSVPFWGGPDGLNTSGTEFGDKVYSYGNSSLRGGATALSPKQGTSYGTNFGGWNHPVVTYPATDVPGDSGSGLMDAGGNALGALSRLSVSVGFPTGTGAADNYADIARGLEYARSHGGPSVTLALGTERFDPVA